MMKTLLVALLVLSVSPAFSAVQKCVDLSGTYKNYAQSPDLNQVVITQVGCHSYNIKFQRDGQWHWFEQYALIAGQKTCTNRGSMHPGQPEHCLSEVEGKPYELPSRDFDLISTIVGLETVEKFHLSEDGQALIYTLPHDYYVFVRVK